MSTDVESDCVAAQDEVDASPTQAVTAGQAHAHAQSGNATHELDGSGDDNVDTDVDRPEAGDYDDATHQARTTAHRRRLRKIRKLRWKAILAYAVFPGLVLILALGAGYLKWVGASANDSQLAGINAVRAASDSTVAMLSYKPDSVDKDLGTAADRLTGQFKDAYSSLVRDVVVPGSKQQHIASVATVAAAAPISATPLHAVVLVFVDQSLTIGNDPPTSTASTVRVTLDKVHDRWLISQFDPI